MSRRTSTSVALCRRSSQCLLAAGIVAVALAAGVVSATAAPSSLPSLRGSIVFIRDGNVWLVRPGGSRLRRVTRDGGYSSPSQADNGSIVALRNGYVVRLTRQGRRVGAPVPLVGSDVRHSGGFTVMFGPADVRVSPNGKLVAYWFGSRAERCDPVSGQCEERLQDTVAYSRVDRFTDPRRYGIVRDYREPSWITSGIALLFNYGLATTVAVNSVGRGEEGLGQWFSDPGGMQLGRGQIARGTGALAVLRGTNRAGAPQRSIRLYTVAGTPPVARPACDITGAVGGRFTQPVWSPDGSGLAWVESNGIHVARVPDLSVAAPDCGTIRSRLLVRANQPFWGPADVASRDGLAAG